jgi:hypothetical protein
MSGCRMQRDQDTTGMSELRDLVLRAHGIDRWQKVKAIDAEMSITGLLWVRKGWPDVLKRVHVTAEARSQRVSYTPFTTESLRSVFCPDEVIVETLDGKAVKSRLNPRAAFNGHQVETGWDELHLAYFSGYAIWNYLNAPFLFALPGIVTEEIEPCSEHGDKRRRLKVTFPDSVATHSSEQIFHIDGDGLIARLDYSANVTGAIPTAHYVSGYCDVDGVKLWTRRRAYRRNADGSANTDAVVVAIDAGDYRLS